MNIHTMSRLKRCVVLGLVLALAPMLGGCFPTGLPDSGMPVTRAAAPKKAEKYEDVQVALDCIRETNVLKPYTIGVGVFTDSTGQVNAVYNQGTLLPQGGSSVLLAAALKDAGANVIDLYENGTERTARDLLSSPKAKLKVDLMVNGIFTSLDFTTVVQADVGIGGVGPNLDEAAAELTTAIQMVQGSNKHLLQVSNISRVVRYHSVGASGGKLLNAMLITGSVTASDQERLQFEALNGPIALGAAAVIVKQFPVAYKACGSMVRELLRGNRLPPELIAQYYAKSED